MKSKNWTLLEKTGKACLWETSIDGRKMFVISIGMGKKIPPSDEPWFRRDSKGLLVVKGSAWRYPYQDNREEMLEWAKKFYLKHC